MMASAGCVLLDVVVTLAALTSAGVLYRYGSSSFGFGPVLRWLFIVGMVGVAAWAGWSIRRLSCASDPFGLFILACGVAAALTSAMVARLLTRERERIARVAADRGIDVDVSQIGSGPSASLKTTVITAVQYWRNKRKSQAEEEHDQESEGER